MDMKRVAVLVVGILVIGLAPALVSAQGLLGAGLPGLPSMGGLMGGSGTCGEKVAGFAAPTFYIGWGWNDPKTSYGAGAEALGVAGITNLRHKYRDTGLWLGLTLPITLSDRIGILASGWYLFPNGTSSEEVYNFNALGGRSWSDKPQWWYVDGLLAFSCGGGGALLAGLRYDSYTVKYTDPTTVGTALPSLVTDEADVISNGWIPLLGVQYSLNNSTTNLVARFVGIPTLAGDVKYNETFGGGLRFDSKANWNGGYFMEFFTEYERKFGGAAGIGVFGRWNCAAGHASLDGTLLSGLANDSYKLGFNRTNWTLGGSINLTFNFPTM